MKSSFTTPEELENFPEEEWIKNYDETHQLKEVPAEILDDIDNDVWKHIENIIFMNM